MKISAILQTFSVFGFNRSKTCWKLIDVLSARYDAKTSWLFVCFVMERDINATVFKDEILRSYINFYVLSTNITFFSIQLIYNCIYSFIMITLCVLYKYETMRNLRNTDVRSFMPGWTISIKTSLHSVWIFLPGEIKIEKHPFSIWIHSLKDLCRQMYIAQAPISFDLQPYLLKQQTTWSSFLRKRVLKKLG